jgi:hypothetical protein
VPPIVFKLVSAVCIPPSLQVISYLLFLKESVEKLQAEAARINKYQALFKVRQRKYLE